MPSSRRDCLALLGGAGATALAGCTTRDVWNEGLSSASETGTAAGGPHSWPMFQHDRYNSGHGDSTGPTGDVSQQWRRPDLMPEDERIHPGASPAVVDDTVFFGSWDGNVYAVSAADGTEQWRFGAGRADAYSSPAVVDGTVYVGYWGPLLYAVSAADGTEQWRYETGDPVTSPVVADGTVYVGSGDTVYAVSAADGSEEWRFETGEVGHSSYVSKSLAVADGAVYVGTGMYSTPPTECEHQGRGCRNEAHPESPHSHSVIALSAADGSIQWRYRTGRAVTSSPAVADGTVYVDSDDGHLYALSADDGSEQWSVEMNTRTSPVVADGTVYVGGRDTVYAVSAADGDPRWRFETKGSSVLAPAVVDRTVYVVSHVQIPDDGGSANGFVYGLSAADGTEQWTFKVARPMPSPAVVDDTVHLGLLALS